MIIYIYYDIEWCCEYCVGKVKFHPGQWEPGLVHFVRPYYEFENKDDAILFLLTYGGEYSSNPPSTTLNFDYE